MDGHIELDVDRWPIVVVTPICGPRPFSESAIDGFLDRYAEAMEDVAGPFATVLDLRRCGNLSPAHRRRITDAMQRRQRERTTQAGFALVFDSRAMQMLLTAIFWVVEPPYPCKVCSSLGEALTWVEQQLEARADGSLAS